MTPPPTTQVSVSKPEHDRFSFAANISLAELMGIVAFVAIVTWHFCEQPQDLVGLAIAFLISTILSIGIVVEGPRQSEFGIIWVVVLLVAVSINPLSFSWALVVAAVFHLILAVYCSTTKVPVRKLLKLSLMCYVTAIFVTNAYHWIR